MTGTIGTWAVTTGSQYTHLFTYLYDSLIRCYFYPRFQVVEVIEFSYRYNRKHIFVNSRRETSLKDAMTYKP